MSNKICEMLDICKVFLSFFLFSFHFLNFFYLLWSNHNNWYQSLFPREKEGRLFVFLNNQKMWFEWFLYIGENLANWEVFTRALCIRFGDREDVVEELNKLTQDKGVDEYIERYKKLKYWMNALNPFLLEYTIFQVL